MRFVRHFCRSRKKRLLLFSMAQKSTNVKGGFAPRERCRGELCSPLRAYHIHPVQSFEWKVMFCGDAAKGSEVFRILSCEAHFTPGGRFTCEASFTFRAAEHIVEKSSSFRPSLFCAPGSVPFRQRVFKNFFATIKKECIYYKKYATIKERRNGGVIMLHRISETRGRFFVLTKRCERGQGDEAIKRSSGLEISIRQFSRLSGISKAVIERVLRG